MDFKELMATSFGLGLVNSLITYPASLLVQLPTHFDVPHLPIAFPLFGVLAVILYTIFYYPYRMSYAFIFSGIISMQLISMIFRTVHLLFSNIQRNLFFEQIKQLFTASAKIQAMVPLNFFVQAVIWFSVILVSNRLALHWFAKSSDMH
ncbi:MAG: hypothetical protein AMXMBFR12_10590 [Candidatus Babeliales bacterium]